MRNKIVLKFNFTDRGGADVYSMHEQSLSDEERFRVIGKIRIKEGMPIAEIDWVVNMSRRESCRERV